MKTISILILCVIAVSAKAWDINLTATSAEQIITTISNDLPHIAAYHPKEPHTLAGRYFNLGVLSGEYLYLFQDNTYIHTFWGDVSPEKIYEKGNWVFHDGMIVNTPDGSLPKALFPKDHTYFPFSSKGETDSTLSTNIYILGAYDGFSYLIENMTPGDYFMFKLCAYEQKEPYDGTKDEKIKADLMKHAWDPEWFKEE